MAYTLDFSLALGLGKSGLSDLRAQLVDTAGSNVGSAVSTGFVEIGTSGNYLWHYASIPDSHRGGVKFYSLADSSTILAFTAINPEEAENTNTKISTLVDSVWAKAMTELSAVPGVTGTVLEALSWCFLMCRNKLTSTASTLTLHNDAGTAIATATQSDDGTTYTRNEWQ